jgi:hypothetical protein
MRVLHVYVYSTFPIPVMMWVLGTAAHLPNRDGRSSVAHRPAALLRLRAAVTRQMVRSYTAVERQN